MKNIWSMLDQHQKCGTLAAMAFGGGFASSIARAMGQADSVNAEIIAVAFDHLFVANAPEEAKKAYIQQTSDGQALSLMDGLANALAINKQALENWVEIADEEDLRDSDQEAINAADEVLKEFRLMKASVGVVAFERLQDLCERSLRALDEDAFPQLRQDLRDALGVM